MYMEGFSFNPVNKDEACLVFLFESAILNTPAKFFFGAITTFFIGLIIEYILHQRRVMKKKFIVTTENYRMIMFKHICLYIVQLLLSYAIMLLAMTFSFTFFMMVILGLCSGHFLFNYNAPISESVEPCCAQLDEVENSITSSDSDADICYEEGEHSADEEENSD